MMTPDRAEKTIETLPDDQIQVAISKLAVKTPGIHYSPGRMYAQLEDRLQNRGVTSAGVKDIMLFVIAATNAIGDLEPDVTNGKVTIEGHSKGDIKTGDWAVSFKRQAYLTEVAPETQDCVDALESVDPEHLRKILGRLIDKTEMGFVIAENSFDTDISGASKIAAGVLHEVLEAGESINLSSLLMRPGSQNAQLIMMTVDRLNMEPTGGEPTLG